MEDRMSRNLDWRLITNWLALLAIGVFALAFVACTGDDDDDVEPTATEAPTQAPTQVATSVPTTPQATETATAEATPVATAEVHDEEDALHLTAASASIVLDGQLDDWADIEGIEVPLEAIPEEFREESTAGEDVTVTLKVATDGANVYVLVAVPDGFDYDPDNGRRSPALAVQWAVDPEISPHMGAAEPDFKESTGMVDIWHWELDCGPGELSGGSFPTGNDPDCNLDDEYATLTDEREDDDADNSITGSWDHTARAQGVGADGLFVFEMARPLRTDDAQDAQFELAAPAFLALAYWDGNEGREEDGGWTDAGHVQSAELGWIEVAFEQ
jgi:ethylbenzene dehydrogenase